jgi:integrase
MWQDDNPKLADQYHVKKFLLFWKDHLKGKKLSDITPKLIHGLVTENFNVDLINPSGPNSTANGYVGIVSRVIRHASNLNPKFTYYPKSRGRDRWLTPDEWETLSAAMNPDLADISLFAISAGLREANCMGFRWSWLKDSDTWALIPPEFTKTAKPYGIPLNLTAQRVIKRRRESGIRHQELVFLFSGRPWYRVMICRQLEAAVEASGVAKITFHGFRHTFASWLAQKGVSHAIRARLGCWSTASMADHYSHFDVESLRQFSEMIDGVLALSPQSREIYRA